MKIKIIFISILAVAVLIGGFILLFKNNDVKNGNQEFTNNVSIVDGSQTIMINAKGGYFPRITNAKANMPTVIKMNTQGTFDCSSALVIPSLGYRNNLPPSGETIIEVPPQNSGTKLDGLCSMGMYGFTINFN